jgi:hypothetical protein
MTFYNCFKNTETPSVGLSAPLSKQQMQDDQFDAMNDFHADVVYYFDKY